MEKNEIIIDQFIKTIKDSPADVSGDPVMLSKVFDVLDKKKKRKRAIGLFTFAAIVLLVLVAGSYYYVRSEIDKNVAEKISTKKLDSQSVDIASIIDESSELGINNIAQQNNTTTAVNKNIPSSKKVSYTFSKHKIDVIKDNSDAFIQINVFGVDGAEKDFLKIVEELKSSYRNNELIVDSVKQK